jgi:DNA invertase Pin-like site-specific DNA recombinase
MLMVDILLSFAQFERELTRERTMSKMLGRAQKGLWHGGHVPLGFAYDKETKQLRDWSTRCRWRTSRS